VTTLDPHPDAGLTAQVFRPTDGGNLGSGYLVRPGTIITALHCVVGENPVPEGTVACEVRLVGDDRKRTPNEQWTWRPATLAWPGAGATFKDCDIAVLVVDEDKRAATMKLDPKLAAHIPQRPPAVEGFGFPNWLKDRNKDKFPFRRIVGTVESEEPQFGFLSQFDVDRSTPVKEEEWGGASGTLLFIKDTNVVAGIVAQRAKAMTNSLLGATLLRKVRTERKFWALTGLAGPTDNDRVLRAATRQMLPSQFLHLFDREKQHGRWKFDVERLLAPKSFVPIVVPFVALTDDGWGFLAKRLEADFETRFPDRKGCYRDAPTLDWTGDIPDPKEAAERILHGIKEHLRINESFDLLADPAPFKTAFDTGSVARAFRMELALDTDAQNIEAILDILFKWLAALGNCDSPVVFFLSIDRARLPPDQREKPFDAGLLFRIAQVAKSHASKLAWLPIAPLLGPCQYDDLEKWEKALRDFNNPLLDLSRFSTADLLDRINPIAAERFSAFPFLRARNALVELRL
jgi:hypothetical protein